MKETKPNIVIFAGPFLDKNAECIKKGEILVKETHYLDFNEAFEIMLDQIQRELGALRVSPVNLLRPNCLRVLI